MESIKKDIMKKIKKHEISMKPKIYFVIGGISLGLGLGLTFLLAVFAANVGMYHLFSLGRLSFRIILLIIIFVGTGAYLLKQFDFSYKKDFGILVTALLAGVLLLGFAISQTKINQKASKVKHLRIIYQSGHPLPPAIQKHIIIRPPTPRFQTF